METVLERHNDPSLLRRTSMQFALASNLFFRETILELNMPFLAMFGITHSQSLLWEGLVIDDYFSVSCEAGSIPNHQAKSVKLLDIAEGTYQKARVFGSDEKTVRGNEGFKVIGAEVLSNQRVRHSGLITAAAPLSKRIPVIALSLAVAEMLAIPKGLAARLAGNWVSILMFRRSACCLLSRIFVFGNKDAASGDEVVKLDRATAEELVLSAILGLSAATDFCTLRCSHLCNRCLQCKRALH